MSGGLIHGELTGKVLKQFYRVYNALGYGFLEKVYESALVIALKQSGLQVERQAPITVYFEGEEVGKYYADILVEGMLIIEIKAAEALTDAHQAQLVNYLKATNIQLGLLLNFGPKPAFIRRVFQPGNHLRSSAQSASSAAHPENAHFLS